MDDQNRYEEVPKKQNPFVKMFKSLGVFIKESWLNFIESFKYNNMKLAAILSAIPGVFIGFFLIFHAGVVRYITYANGVGGYYVFSFDFSALTLFILMLLSIINIFNSLGMSNKKNLGSVIRTTICTSGIVIAGAFYLVGIFVFMSGVQSGGIPMQTAVDFNYNWVISIASIVVSILTSVAGVVLGFINYDRTYEKVDR